MTHNYSISGMTCKGCVSKVKSELLKLGDVESAEVQLQSPQATITMRKHIPAASLQQAISRAGNYTIKEEDGGMQSHNDTIIAGEAGKASYFPIFLIFGYIAVASLFIQLTAASFDVMQWMRHFMAGFFLVFSFFKLMNLQGFAEGYRTYDIVAGKVPEWGFIYPFVELALGIAFLTNIFPLGVNMVAFIVMAVSSAGVIKSLRTKKQFQCACLGTIIRLPLGKVTLFEDLLMVAMSFLSIIGMLFFHT